MARTEREIVDQTNELAAYMLTVIGSGYVAPEGHLFYEGEDPRSKAAWRHACVIQEFMTGTDAQDALCILIDDEIAEQHKLPHFGEF